MASRSTSCTRNCRPPGRAWNLRDRPDPTDSLTTSAHWPGLVGGIGCWSAPSRPRARPVEARLTERRGELSLGHCAWPPRAHPRLGGRPGVPAPLGADQGRPGPQEGPGRAHRATAGRQGKDQAIDRRLRRTLAAQPSGPLDQLTVPRARGLRGCAPGARVACFQWGHRLVTAEQQPPAIGIAAWLVRGGDGSSAIVPSITFEVPMSPLVQPRHSSSPRARRTVLMALSRPAVVVGASIPVGPIPDSGASANSKFLYNQSV